MSDFQAKELFAELFPRWRPARSAAYRSGVLAKLEHLTGERSTVPPSGYEQGAAEHDAYYAGLEEALMIYKHKCAERDEEGRGKLITRQQGEELHKAVCFTAETLGPQEARDTYNSMMCDFGQPDKRFASEGCGTPQAFADLIYSQTELAQ